ncbi:hypothetical protein [Photobacterium leiognathi]|uniref:hypothetical protein n=1 Tax=Photobacterium leiognathi TaxID=553611 RepID=UPI002981693C|nr:hypothetical protein [Photobacterium leiognathi]
MNELKNLQININNVMTKISSQSLKCVDIDLFEPIKNDLVSDSLDQTMTNELTTLILTAIRNLQRGILNAKNKQRASLLDFEIAVGQRELERIFDKAS